MVKKEINTMVIPDYVLQTLKSKDVDLHKLESMIEKVFKTPIPGCSNELPDFNNPENPAYGYLKRVNTFHTFLKEKLSSYDIADLVVINKLLEKKVLNGKHGSMDRFFISSELLPFLFTIDYIRDNIASNENKIEQELINHYTDKNVSLNTIIVNKDDDGVNKPYRLEVVGDMIFIVLYSGFFNCISYKDDSFKSFFIEDVIRFMFSKFRSQAVYDSYLFEVYSRLKLN